MPPKKASLGLGAALQPLDVNQETLREARPKKGTSRPSINRSRGRRRRCFTSPIYRRRSTKLLRKCVISLKMTRTDDLNAESFVRTIPMMMMSGMMISIMEILLLMMLLLCQQNCRLPHGPHQTSHLSSPMYDGHSDPKQFLMSYEATISSYGGNIVMAKSFVMAIKNVAQTWYSSLRPGTITS
jgi:hypothetical protein